MDITKLEPLISTIPLCFHYNYYCIISIINIVLLTLYHADRRWLS